MPDISVIIPVYNAYPYIKRCLETVLNQLGVSLEIIIIDDASTDESLSVVQDFADKDKRIIFIKNNQRLGAGISRNIAMDLAKGKFIAFIDADDFYPNEKTLNLLFKNAENQGALVCGGSLYKFDSKKEEILKEVQDQYWVENGYVNYADYQHDGGFYRFIYEREFLNKQQLRFKGLSRFQDAEFFVRAMIIAQKFYVLKDCTYIYRINHKKVPWNYELFKDQMLGILSILTISKKYNYKTLHYKAAKNFLDLLKHKMRYQYYKKILLLPLIIKVFKHIHFALLRDKNFKVSLYPSKFFLAYFF